MALLHSAETVTTVSADLCVPTTNTSSTEKKKNEAHPQSFLYKFLQLNFSWLFVYDRQHTQHYKIS
jgi:hypothetical protein